MKMLKKSVLVLSMLLSVYQMVEATQNHYELLGVKPDASAAEIRTAYRKAALATHTDKGGSDEAFIAVSKAYAVLEDDTSRGAYDRSLGIKSQDSLNTKKNNELSKVGNYYDLLNIKPNASIEEIKAAYRIASEAAHPGKLPVGSSELIIQSAKNKFNAINQAYKTLQNNDSRDAYDKKEGIESQRPLNMDVQISLYKTLTGVDEATAKKELLNDTRTKKGHLAKANAMAHKFMDGSVNFLVAHQGKISVGIETMKRVLPLAVPILQKPESLDYRGFIRAMNALQVIVDQAVAYDEAKKAKNKKGMDAAMTSVCMELLKFLDLLNPVAKADPKEDENFAAFADL